MAMNWMNNSCWRIFHAIHLFRSYQHISTIFLSHFIHNDMADSYSNNFFSLHKKIRFRLPPLVLLRISLSISSNPSLLCISSLIPLAFLFSLPPLNLRLNFSFLCIFSPCQLFFEIRIICHSSLRYFRHSFPFLFWFLLLFASRDNFSNIFYSFEFIYFFDSTWIDAFTKYGLSFFFLIFFPNTCLSSITSCFFSSRLLSFLLFCLRFAQLQLSKCAVIG